MFRELRPEIGSGLDVGLSRCGACWSMPRGPQAVRVSLCAVVREERAVAAGQDAPRVASVQVDALAGLAPPSSAAPTRSARPNAFVDGTLKRTATGEVIVVLCADDIFVGFRPQDTLPLCPLFIVKPVARNPESEEQSHARSPCARTFRTLSAVRRVEAFACTRGRLALGRASAIPPR